MSTIPEVTDADMELQAATIQGDDDPELEKPFWKRYQVFHAAAAQFLYTGGQSMYFRSLTRWLGEMSG